MSDFKFKKSLGQNFLQDNNVIHKIVDKSVYNYYFLWIIIISDGKDEYG